MKRTLIALSLILGLLVVGCFSATAAGDRLAPYLSKYTEVDAPAQENRVISTIPDFPMWWNQTEVVGEWTIPGGTTTGCVGWMDNDLKTFVLQYTSVVTATEYVFADAFSAYGAGDYGYSKMQPSDWERFTLVGSVNGTTWFEIPFTVSYHLEKGNIWTGSHSSVANGIPADLWWHLVFEEEVEAKYFAFHTSNEASQDLNAYELCVCLDVNTIFVVGSASDTEVTEAPATQAPETEAPAPEVAPGELILDGRTNNHAQWPDFVDNGDGTYTVNIKNGANVPGSWTDDNPMNAQWTNQNGGEVTWNLYFPRVAYPFTVKASALVWNVHTLNDASDLEDFEVYYSNDGASWIKAEDVTISTFDPVLPTGGTAFDASCGATYGVRFAFANAIEAKYFFAYDPNPIELNVFHYPAFFAAEQAGEDDVVTEAPATQAPATDAPVVTDAPSTEPGSPSTSDFAVASLAIVALAAAGVAICSKKKSK
jgi:hypothetical protein